MTKSKNPFPKLSEPPLYMKSGWRPMNGESKTSSIEVNLEATEDASIDYIKAAIAQQITDSLLEGNYIKITKKPTINDYYTHNIRYTGRIHIVEQPMVYVNMTFDGFKVKDRVFTNEELVEAVENYFAEYLL